MVHFRPWSQEGGPLHYLGGSSWESPEPPVSQLFPSAERSWLAFDSMSFQCIRSSYHGQNKSTCSYFIFVDTDRWQEDNNCLLEFNMLKHLVGVSQVVQVVKKPPANSGDTRDTVLILGSGRSPGGGQGNIFQYSGLENPMDRGAWWSTALQRIRHNWSNFASIHLINLLQINLRLSKICNSKHILGACYSSWKRFLRIVCTSGYIFIRDFW